MKWQRTAFERSEIGFLTLAVWSADYAEMAVDMALSLHEWHDEPIAIAVDAAMEAYVVQRYPSVFDAVIRLPDSVPPGWASKLAVAEVSPFPRTVFLDADTIVLGSLHSLLADAERADFAMMGEYHRCPTSELHNGVSIEAVIREFSLDRYFHAASCAFVFEREYGRDFLADCMAVWLENLSPSSLRPFEGAGDEVALGIVAARRGMAVLREPFPVYWQADLLELRPDNRWKPLCHMHNPPPHETMKWLMAEVVARRRRHGLSRLSIGHWLRKPMRKGLATGWLTLAQNLDLRRHAAWYAHAARLPAELPCRTGVGAATEYVHPTSRRAGDQMDATHLNWARAGVPFERDWNASNLLLQSTRRRQLISTPHVDLAIRETWDRDFQVPVALAIHCWPEPPTDLSVSVRWNERDHQPILEFKLLGSLLRHRDAVVCVRFRGRQAKELDPSGALLANLRSTLVSSGVLLNSALAVGVGGHYLATTTIVDASRSVDHAFSIPARPWPAGHDELFLEFRLAVAGVELSDEAVQIEFSCFYLGQKASHSPFDRRYGAAVPTSLQAG